MMSRSWLAVWIGLLSGGPGCVLPISESGDGSPSSQPTAPQDAGPPALCTAHAPSSPFCTTADAGLCPLLADEIIACPPGALPSSGQVGLGTAPGGGGDIAFAAVNDDRSQPSEYVELGLFGAAGSSPTFTLGAFAPIPFDGSGAQANASLVVLTSPSGAPIVLDTLDLSLRVAIGLAASGATFAVESAVPAPAGGEGGWLVAGAGVEPGGALDVLLQAGADVELAHRDTTGHWTTRALSLPGGPLAMALDAKGTPYVAGWAAPATSGGMQQLELVVGSSAPVPIATASAMDVTTVEVTVGQASDGSPLPVVAYGQTLSLALPDGKGGYTTIQPQLTVQTPYVDGCMDSLSLGNCSCASSCSQKGDQIDTVQLVRDAAGDVYVAWLEVDEDMVFPVTLNSTSYGNQMITCSCTVAGTPSTYSSVAVGLQLERLVPGPSAHTEHRGMIPVPPATVGLQAADGNGTLQVLVAGTAAEGPNNLRRVVLDANKLP